MLWKAVERIIPDIRKRAEISMVRGTPAHMRSCRRSVSYTVPASCRVCLRSKKWSWPPSVPAWPWSANGKTLLHSCRWGHP